MRYGEPRPKNDESERGGIPGWVLSPRFLLLLALPVYLIAQPALKAMAGLFEPAAIERACFPLDTVRPYTLKNEPFSRPDPKRYSDLVSKRAAAKRLLVAIEQCRMDDCPDAARKAYRHALRKYANKRAYFTRWHDMEYGEAGLAFSTDSFDATEDRDIARDIEKRWNAAWFEERDLADVRDMIRLIATKPVREVLPCRD